jgi:hypothetical protein
MSEDKYEVLFMQGVEGPSIYINDYRICGNKPWGGGTIGHKWQTTLDSIINAIPALTALREEVENQRNKRKHEEELKLEAYEENGNLRAALQAVERERDDLASELALNASMLAEQCDLARVAEMEWMRFKKLWVESESKFHHVGGQKMLDRLNYLNEQEPKLIQRAEKAEAALKKAEKEVEKCQTCSQYEARKRAEAKLREIEELPS